MKTFEKRICCGWGLLACIWASQAVSAQPVPLTIQKTDSRVSISWTSGLSLVQPQIATNLGGGAWQDLGTATTLTNFVETLGTGNAFYRLRFLPPNILTQPQGQNLSGGAKAILEVTATGTAPLDFQWRRNGTNLTGRTTASLVLTNITSTDAGDYSVVLANRAGSVTSVVATLTLAAPVVPPRGIFMGNFAGQTNGGFAALVASNGLGFFLGARPASAELLYSTNSPIGIDGSISLTTDKSGQVTGAFGADGVTGTLASTNGVKTDFSATRKPDAGVHQANAGFYAGTFDGLLSGNAHFILAADGTAFVFIASPTLGGGGTFGAIDAAGSLAATTAYTLPGTTVPAQIQISGKLNPATHLFTGTYSLGAFTLGTFTITRAATP